MGDLALIREHFPRGGPRAVWEALPEGRKRSIDAIHCYARHLGLRLRGKPSTVRRAPTPAIDEAIRARLTVSEVSARFGLSREWVRHRARKLQVHHDVRVPRRWSAAEDAVLAATEGKPAKSTRAALAKAGFHRTVRAIEIRRSVLQISGRREFDGYHTMTALAALLGRDEGTIRRWTVLRKAPLPVRVEGQVYLIRDTHTREFIARHPELMDFTRLPRASYAWLVELLTDLSPGEAP